MAYRGARLAAYGRRYLGSPASLASRPRNPGVVEDAEVEVV